MAAVFVSCVDVVLQTHVGPSWSGSRAGKELRVYGDTENHGFVERFQLKGKCTFILQSVDQLLTRGV